MDNELLANTPGAFADVGDYSSHEKLTIQQQQSTLILKKGKRAAKNRTQSLIRFDYDGKTDDGNTVLGDGEVDGLGMNIKDGKSRGMIVLRDETMNL